MTTPPVHSGPQDGGSARGASGPTAPCRRPRRDPRVSQPREHLKGLIDPPVERGLRRRQSPPLVRRSPDMRTSPRATDRRCPRTRRRSRPSRYDLTPRNFSQRALPGTRNDNTDLYQKIRALSVDPHIFCLRSRVQPAMSVEMTPPPRHAEPQPLLAHVAAHRRVVGLRRDLRERHHAQ